VSEIVVRYALNGDVSLAYHVFGEGDTELVEVQPFGGHIELVWEEPLFARFFEREARFARILHYDRRGCGLSDPADGELTLEEQVGDLLAVIDAAGFERPVLQSFGDGGRLAILFAATHPDRTGGLILASTCAAGAAVYAPEVAEHIDGLMAEHWGSGELVGLWAPSLAHDVRFKRWFGRLERYSCGPGMARRGARLSAHTDVRGVLASLSVPTLVIHRRDDGFVPVELARAMADAIPTAEMVELEGVDSAHFVGDSESWLDAVERWLTGELAAATGDRILATVLFTDIVGSTSRAAELGDQAWRDLVAEHDRIVRRLLDRHHGREIKTMGDGFLATFDGPARAIRAAQGMTSEVRAIGIELRAGIHTGECERVGEDIAGMAVNVAARVSALAQAGEVLVSGTVKDLVIGSGLSFEDRGVHGLKGVTDPWRLYAAIERRTATR
jgi:class 3 adenylate cyclase